MKHLRSIFLALVVVVLLSPLAFNAVSADSTPVNGWTNQGGSGYDFYFTPNNEVSPTELCLFINYQASVTTLIVLEGNKTIFTQAVNPHSSMFISLPFSDVETTYTIEVMNSGFVLQSMTRTAPGYYLPTQNDNGNWHIAPPAAVTNGTAKYSQSYLDALVGMLTIQVLLCSLVAAVIGIVLGAFVKRIVLFFVPVDVISIFVFLFVFTDIVWNWTHFGIGIYYLPFVAGYFLGFFIAHISYVEAEVLDLGGKARSGRPYVIYSPNEEVGHCIQQQSNKALIKRWLGYHHRLGMDGPLSPDLADSRKYPYFPLFRKQILSIEDSTTEYHDEPFFFGLFQVRVYTTYWRLSNVCKFPKGQWINSSATIIWARDLIQRLTADLVNERQKNHMEATKVASDMLSYTVDRSTHRAIYEKFAGPVAPLTIPEPTENVMRDVTATVSQPQKMPEDTEPENTERQKKRNNDMEDDREPSMDEEDSENDNNKKKRRND